MSASAEFIELIVDLMSGLARPVCVRAMFGGAGVYADGVMFGLIADDVLYLKADAASREKFEAEGLGPFVYDGKKGKPIAMSYWRVPSRVLDDGDEMVVWARTALDVARRLKKPRSKSTRTTKKRGKSRKA